MPPAAKQLDAPVALSPAQCCDLFEDLAQITDPRQQRGRQHPLGVVLAVAVAAVRVGVDPDALPQPIAERLKEPFALGPQPLVLDAQPLSFGLHPLLSSQAGDDPQVAPA